MHISAVYFLHLEMDSKVRLMWFAAKTLLWSRQGSIYLLKEKVIFILVTDQLAARGGCRKGENGFFMPELWIAEKIHT
ncbi:hypothetical protein Bca4012_101590 [Brassica carinata]